MLISVAQAQLFFLAFTRIMAALVHVPVFGGQLVPAQVRIALGLILAAVLLPWQPLPADAPALGAFGMAAAVFTELVTGTLVGFAATLTFGAVQIAAEAMGLGSGFASSRIFNPSMEASSSAFDQLFIMVAMLFFLVTDGHHLFLLALQRTFTLLPLQSPLPASSLEALLRMAAQLITTGVHMALPVLFALVLTDIALGLLARVAPQVQIYFLGLPLKVGVSLAALGLVLGVLLPAMGSLYTDLAERMLRLVE